VELFHGIIDAAAVYLREVVKEALRVSAAAVIFSHNHPSGNPEPSQAGKLLTQRLKEALARVDVRTLDHIIVGSETTRSFASRGCSNRWGLRSPFCCAAEEGESGHPRPVAGRAVVLCIEPRCARLMPSARLPQACALRLHVVVANAVAVACRSAFPWLHHLVATVARRMEPSRRAWPCPRLRHPGAYLLDGTRPRAPERRGR